MALTLDVKEGRLLQGPWEDTGPCRATAVSPPGLLPCPAGSAGLPGSVRLHLTSSCRLVSGCAVSV